MYTYSYTYIHIHISVRVYETGKGKESGKAKRRKMKRQRVGVGRRKICTNVETETHRLTAHNVCKPRLLYRRFHWRASLYTQASSPRARRIISRTFRATIQCQPLRDCTSKARQRAGRRSGKVTIPRVSSTRRRRKFAHE